MIQQERVTTRTAAALLGTSVYIVRRLCNAGVFKTASKPGTGRNAHISILRSEVLARKLEQNMTVPKYE